MITYLLILFVFALGITLWSMRGFGKKTIKHTKHEVKQGSIVMLKDNVQHYQ
jgi:hypothetical protein